MVAEKREGEVDETPALKKGVGVYLYYWTIPAFLIFLIVNQQVSKFEIEAMDLNLMISVVTFLFGFLVTVTFSMLMGKTNELKNALAIETGRLIAIFLFSKHLGQKFCEKIRDRIDRYTVQTLKDYVHYEIGREEFYGLFDDLQYMEIKEPYQQSCASYLIAALNHCEANREKLEFLTSRRIEWSLKFANYLLGSILIVLLFLNRGTAFTNALFVILSTTVVFIFLILEDYDDLRIGDYTYNISNSEQIFDLLGTDRYYPEEVLDRVVLVHGKRYRIGIFNPRTKEEKIHAISYSSRNHDTNLKKILDKFRRR